MEQIRNTFEALDAHRVCPLCITLDQVERPLERHLALRLDGLHESWHCRTCHSTFTPPQPYASAAEGWHHSPLA